MCAEVCCTAIYYIHTSIDIDVCVSVSVRVRFYVSGGLCVRVCGCMCVRVYVSEQLYAFARRDTHRQQVRHQRHKYVVWQRLWIAAQKHGQRRWDVVEDQELCPSRCCRAVWC